jgi:malonyl-CoA/methylmalonyl-CoA synthetase
MTAQARLLHDWRDGGERPALRDEEHAWSFDELSQRADQWMEAFTRRGLQPGDRVAAWLSTSAAAVAAMLGALRAGACWVPINRRYQTAELGHILRDSAARWLLVDEMAAGAQPAASSVAVLGAGAGALPSAPPTAAPDPGARAHLLIYTSGTTGPSKGVLLSPDAVADGIGALVDAWRFDSTDHLSLSLPLFHVHGLCIGVFGALLRRARVSLHARFDPAVIVDDVAREGATVVMGVPTMYVALLDHLRAHPDQGARLASARLWTAGSAALRPDVLDGFERATGHRILERYGMTETLISLSNPYEGPRRAGHVGYPVPGYQVRIVDDDGGDVDDGEAGELWVRGPGLMTGYWGLPQATADAFTDGWFRTGDVASRGEGGAIAIVGRQSTDIIKSGGFKIATGEIEQVLREHPDVADAAVVGVPDARWGERIGAGIELSAGVAPRDLTAELGAFVAQRLADYKRPRQVLVVPALPRNALGKVVKTQLRAQLVSASDDASRG